ncbi:stemmadenine O-acetyltransferase [Ziziphus jujuba]|uniref:Stemmadenine O-acetyltransferase n=1 Tax=Ziziphus jujuba TaxID=326968 RepID=A0A6P3ZEX1_ZIZJJ|nr:stemmadenine O-acetyltransferase [Ziziphus jujuba]XP_015876448.2 stemmadenine O-acetyltransferase [Ziziphus jujuba]XP_048326319.1 stemmadenine O-acetyltransferase-like [Ziziphus jujuba var. spinosa]
MKIEIISREFVKPSSPTPNHLRNYKLSLLDQLVRPCVYISKLYLYPENHIPIHQRLHKLKNSLSETLTRFYPLAGRIKDNISIECHDDGALYTEARVHGFLLDFLKLEPHYKQRERLLPDKTEFFDTASPPLLLVQANFFECGGLALGFYMCHKFGDGGTLNLFIKYWASIAYGHEKELLPALDFDAGSSRFPPSEDFKVQEPPVKNLRYANHVTKRYVFDARKIAALKTKVASPLVQQPTRTEAILALIWRCAISASRLNKGVSMHYVMHQLVNIRNRVEPPFPKNSVGNFVQYFSVQAEDVKTELQDLVALLRKGINEFGENEVKRLSGEDAFGEIVRSSKKRREISGRDDVRLFTCTSVCSINFYEADFGWGKPMWMSMESGSNLNNFAILTNTREGNGVEAWVSLSEKEMEYFESDPELLEFASLNPSVSHSRL